ncbi:protein FAM32A [Ochlerotatus camptorhynchus]|uniref:protein FAM32A n=1 Tax=Ochlerotatus camptorhynchus TaxID=644619 RepID=UPI0031E107B8
MSDQYDYAGKGKLKLKSDSEIKKKKKKKSKDKDKLREKVEKSLEQSGSSSSQQSQTQAPSTGRVLTKAEESFKKMQEKMQKKRIMDKASMTHKQRVEQFNQHLDSLTEHFDIPKVSWTK